MEYLAFLEKDERIKLSVLALLAETGHQVVPVKQVLDQLSITRYKFNQLIAELIEDLQQIKQCQYQLKVKDGTVISEHIDYSIYQQMQLFYLRQSPRFQIFEYEYLNQQMESRQKFLRDHFMSQSKYYTLRGQVENLLDNKALMQKRSEGGNLHPELVERAKITNVYCHFFNGIDDPFPELKEQTSRFCTFLCMTLGISLTPSERFKLRIFFQVQVKRLTGCHYMNIRNIATLKRDERLPFLKNYYLKNVWHSKQADIDSEISYLLLFLKSQRIMDSVPVKLCKQIQLQFNRGSQRFEQVLTETNVVEQKKFSAAVKQRTADRLSELTIWLMVFDYFELTETNSTDQPHMSMNFPALTVLGKRLVDAAAKTFDLQLSPEVQSRLLKCYVKILIDGIPSNLVKDNVTICVDFVQSIVPMDYFAQLLTTNLGAGIVLTNQLSSDVDIFLSDIYISSIHDIPQVTWLDPLKTSNWEQLRQTIAEVKQAKLEKFMAAS